MFGIPTWTEACHEAAAPEPAGHRIGRGDHGQRVLYATRLTGNSGLGDELLAPCLDRAETTLPSSGRRSSGRWSGGISGARRGYLPGEALSAASLGLPARHRGLLRGRVLAADRGRNVAPLR